MTSCEIWTCPLMACSEVHAELAFRFMEAELFDIDHIWCCFRDALCLACGEPGRHIIVAFRHRPTTR